MWWWHWYPAYEPLVRRWVRRMRSNRGRGAQPVTPRWGCGYSVSPPAMTTLLIDTSNLLWAVSTAWMLYRVRFPGRVDQGAVSLGAVCVADHGKAFELVH